MGSGERCYRVYILASRLGGTLYIGVTNDLIRRVDEHKMGLADGFTKKHGIHRLVYYEQYNDIADALLQEKRLKKWNRAWKIQLIEEKNPNWVDLYPQIARP
jgi:putative endonuclease